MSDIPEAKSLRWLAVQFLYVKNPKDDVDRLSNAIHLYATRGADCICRLHDEVVSLRSKLRAEHPELLEGGDPYG